MEYINGVLSRLDIKGLLLIALGCVLVYGSDKIAAKIIKTKQDTWSLIMKAVGGVAAIVGALILLDII